MKIYVDDVRSAPKGYRLATNVKEVKILCYQHLDSSKTLRIELIDLDHDAGDYAFMGGDYIEILKWLEMKQYMEGWKIPTAFHIHSGNPVGRQRMRQIIEHCGWTYIE